MFFAKLGKLPPPMTHNLWACRREGSLCLPNVSTFAAYFVSFVASHTYRNVSPFFTHHAWNNKLLREAGRDGVESPHFLVVSGINKQFNSISQLVSSAVERCQQKELQTDSLPIRFSSLYRPHEYILHLNEDGKIGWGSEDNA